MVVYYDFSQVLKAFLASDCILPTSVARINVLCLSANLDLFCLFFYCLYRSSLQQQSFARLDTPYSILLLLNTEFSMDAITNI